MGAPVAVIDINSRSPHFPVAIGVEARRFLTRVYLWMTGGMALTAVTALYISSTPSLVMGLMQNRLLFYGLMVAELVIVVAFVSLSRRVSHAVATAMFLGYAVLTGVTLSVVFLAYTSSSIAGTFIAASGTFAGVSVFGAVTKRSLASWASFLFMGLFGVVIASVVNLFLGSPLVSWVTSSVGVLVFTGLTAYDTQKLVLMSAEEGINADSRAAVRGALILYLDFINLFLDLLRLFGSRR